MKIILSGGTGYIGGEVLTQCLNHPSVTSIIVLTRRDPGHLTENPKVKVIIVKDFASYDEFTFNDLKDADAAIWCIGTYTGSDKIDIEYPLAFINAIKTRQPRPTKFRYVHLGGAFTEPPPKEGEKERALWFFTNGRRIRGAAEARVQASAEDDSQSRLTVFVVKPAAVVPQGRAFLQCIIGDSFSIGVKEVGATMVDLAVHGNEQQIFLNKDIAKHGRRLQENSR